MNSNVLILLQKVWDRTMVLQSHKVSILDSVLAQNQMYWLAQNGWLATDSRWYWLTEQSISVLIQEYEKVG